LVQPHLSLLLAECGLSANGVIRDSGLPDVVAPSASQHPVEDLPADTLIFLLGSRYCETQRLFRRGLEPLRKVATAVGARSRRSVISSHRHITFGYEHARATMTSWKSSMKVRGCVATSRISPSRLLPLQ